MSHFFKIGWAALRRAPNFWRRGSAALPLLTLCLLSFAAKAQTTNNLSDAEIQGRQIARQLCESRPSNGFTNSGTMFIRGSGGAHTNLAFCSQVLVTESNWMSCYNVILDPRFVLGNVVSLEIVHSPNQSNEYDFADGSCLSALIKNNETAIAFANSDFWLCDLGLEFFHWPVQKVLPKPTNLVRGREYTLLESTNPEPPTNGYSRVLTWIDKESGGILQAEAYDFHGRRLKEFAPKSFKKVNGQWELQEMEIRNVQTGSRTRLEFDLGK